MSYEPMMARYGHSREVTSLVLSLYVIGCKLRDIDTIMYISC